MEKAEGFTGVEITYVMFRRAMARSGARRFPFRSTLMIPKRAQSFIPKNEPDMMWLTTMNPETRRLIKVIPDEVEETARMFDLLLGDNLTGRKEYIAEFGSQYLEMADIS